MKKAGPVLAAASSIMVAGCIVPPTPEQIARCHNDSRIELPAAPKARSLRLVGDSWTYRHCRTCRDLLRDRNLDFVELHPSTGRDEGVDRVRLHPQGSPACIVKPVADRSLAPPAYRMRTPPGYCIGIETQVAPNADTAIRVEVVPTADHPATVTLATRGEAVLGRIVDFRAEFADAAGSSCATILDDFPARAIDAIIGHVTEPRDDRPER